MWLAAADSAPAMPYTYIIAYTLRANVLSQYNLLSTVQISTVTWTFYIILIGISWLFYLKLSACPLLPTKYYNAHGSVKAITLQFVVYVKFLRDLCNFLKIKSRIEFTTLQVIEYIYILFLKFDTCHIQNINYIVHKYKCK